MPRRETPASGGETSEKRIFEETFLFLKKNLYLFFFSRPLSDLRRGGRGCGGFEIWLAKLKVEEVDVDGCLSAEPSDLRGQFKTEWEGHGFFLQRPLKEHFFFFFTAT